MATKKELHLYCKNFVRERLERIQANIQDIRISLASETKSSAGDKHETGRAMLHLEREKLGQQLTEAEKINLLLSKVPINNNKECIALGSFVKTSKANYYIAISAGEFKKHEQVVYCISAGTPIGKLLLGKSVGDIVTYNGECIKILEII